ncbi:unnamed protein product [Sphagnum troendelagicum]|uniref:J domain-containing protein n=1 Tax=Sphagnum troendelagicum TaxID=128251 RepID=A0ABP0V0Z7_9BRYO
MTMSSTIRTARCSSSAIIFERKCVDHDTRLPLTWRTRVAFKDHYATLGVSPGASKHEIKKAYRRLALQYHPDVCDGEHCSLNFQQINKAYESLLSKRTLQFGEFEDDLSDNLEGFMGVGDDCWEDWEEWMGWEGAGIRDFSSHVNVHT